MQWCIKSTIPFFGSEQCVEGHRGEKILLYFLEEPLLEESPKAYGRPDKGLFLWPGVSGMGRASWWKHPLQDARMLAGGGPTGKGERSLAHWGSTCVSVMLVTGCETGSCEAAGRSRETRWGVWELLLHLVAGLGDRRTFVCSSAFLPYSSPNPSPQFLHAFHPLRKSHLRRLSNSKTDAADKLSLWDKWMSAAWSTLVCIKGR